MMACSAAKAGSFQAAKMAVHAAARQYLSKQMELQQQAQQEAAPLQQRPQQLREASPQLASSSRVTASLLVPHGRSPLPQLPLATVETYGSYPNSRPSTDRPTAA